MIDDFDFGCVFWVGDFDLVVVGGGVVVEGGGDGDLGVGIGVCVVVGVEGGVELG